MAGTHEQWDIVSGVGLTALVVAAGRAVETHRADGLVDDPWAEAFVAAADPPRPLPVRPEDDGRDAGSSSVLSDYMGVRSAFFDRFLVDASRAGTGQVVILAAGLDTRAHRLDWAPGTVVFEVDQPDVLAFKDDVLDREGARPRSDRRVVPVDLRDDWGAALEAAGFDPSAPSAWLAEGLLPYLPADAEAALLDAVARRAAPGSRLAVEDFGDIAAQASDEEFRRLGEQVGVDLASLVHTEGRTEPGAWLSARGWAVARHPANDVAADLGRTFDGPTARLQGRASFVTAHLPG